MVRMTLGAAASKGYMIQGVGRPGHKRAWKLPYKGGSQLVDRIEIVILP